MIEALKPAPAFLLFFFALLCFANLVVKNIDRPC